MRSSDESISSEAVTIVHVVNEPTGGGAELLVRELNQRLGESGQRSRILFLTNRKNFRLQENEHALDLKNPRDPRAFFLIRRFVLDIPGPVVLHAHLTYPLYYVGCCPWPRRIRLVYTEHNTYNRRRDLPALRPVERRIYGRFHAIAGISEGATQALTRWLAPTFDESKISTVLNGARLFAPSTRQRRAGNPLRLLSIGSLSHQKGFDTALAAVERAGRAVIDRYMIVGEGAHRTELETAVERLGLGDQVELCGWQDDVERFLAEADLLLMPSRWEGFGLVAIEALSTGLPIVASDVPGLSDILRGCNAAELIPPDDAPALALAITRFSQAAGRDRAALHDAACSHAQSFSLDSMTNSYRELYRTLSRDE